MDSADNPNEGNLNYTKEGTLQYDETVNRYQLIGEDQGHGKTPTQTSVLVYAEVDLF